MNDSIEIFAIFFVCLLFCFTFFRCLLALFSVRSCLFYTLCIWFVAYWKLENCLSKRKSVDVLAARSMIFYQFNVKHVDDETKWESTKSFFFHILSTGSCISNFVEKLKACTHSILKTVTTTITLTLTWRRKKSTAILVDTLLLERILFYCSHSPSLSISFSRFLSF